MVEEWRDIKGYQGKYQISNTGKVRSLNYHREGRIKELIPKDCRGYLQIGLTKKGKKRFYAIHRLVADSFIGNGDGKQVNHKDLNKKNNNTENLEYVTARENTIHAIQNGRFDSSSQQLHEANEKRKIGVLAVKNGIVSRFTSIREASRKLSIDRKQIKQSLQNKYPLAKGYRFFYVAGGD
ncbi:NUMOD4 domain-containing protein [Megasphaera stantonii]|uniref:NUMOD4 domain-containing protein n=1 Tax=Megasphaera stantonii TaxID=2144175 RepID=UPI0013C2FA3F|nr:NUMOD4 domain-containing protein [Megasphaera stantonii]